MKPTKAIDRLGENKPPCPEMKRTTNELQPNLRGHIVRQEFWQCSKLRRRRRRHGLFRHSFSFSVVVVWLWEHNTIPFSRIASSHSIEKGGREEGRKGEREEERRSSSPLGEWQRGKSAAAVSAERLIYMPETPPISSLHLPASS